MDSFAGSYGEDGTIFGLSDTPVQLEIVRSAEPVVRVDRVDMLVLYLPGAAAHERVVARMAAAGVQPTSHHPYWPRTAARPTTIRTGARSCSCRGLRARPDLTEHY